MGAGLHEGTAGLWLSDSRGGGGGGGAAGGSVSSSHSQTVVVTHLCLRAGGEKKKSSGEKMPRAASASLLFVAMCVCCVEQRVCFPNGSVASSCGSLVPEHPPFGPSAGSPPFTLSTSSATYRPGGVVTVTVEVVESSPSEFQGFLLQARSTQGNALLWPVGKFTNIDTSQFTALHCKNMENSTVSQASGAKRKKVQLTWEAPSNSNYGDIYFSATLVQDYTTFWVNLNSSSLRLDNSGNSAAGVVFSSALLFINLLSLSAYC